MKNILPAILAFACMATSTLCAQQDKAILDALVSNGALSQTEATQISKSMAGFVVACPETAQQVKLSSRFQLQYEWTQTNFITESNIPSQSSQGFIVRRIFLQADAKLGEGFDARISVELARSEIKSVLTDTYIAKHFDVEYLKGRLCAGYMKPRFAYEDVMSSFDLYTIERTVATMYWTGEANGRRLGVGNRYAGVFWFGEVNQIKGLKYWTSATNSYQLSPNNYLISYNNNNNNLAYWFGASYDIESDDYKLQLGFHSGYSSTANKKLGIGGAFASIWSLNPYYAGHYGNLHFWGDFLTSGVADGKKDSQGNWTQANPYGLNFCVEYRFDIGDYGKIAPAFSYSWLDTGGRGLSTKDGVRQSRSANRLFSTAQGFMGGLNWYLRGNDLKLQLGFEYVQYSGNPNDASISNVAEAMAIRTQFQMKL